MRSILLSALLCTSAALTGCGPLIFPAQGVVASEGGPLGTWQSRPQGCSRDPFALPVDGAPAAHTSSILTFLWDDPAVRDPQRDLHRSTAPDAPMRLELARAGSGYTIALDTVKTHGTRIDSATCQSFHVDTHEGPRDIPEGKPTLAGSVLFACGQVKADVHFERCEY